MNNRHHHSIKVVQVEVSMFFILMMTFKKNVWYYSWVATDGYGNAQGNYSSYGSGGNVGVLGGNGYDASSPYDGLHQQLSSGASFANGGGGVYSSNGFEQQSSASKTNYATDSQGLFQDPNPQILRRPALGGTQTYTQRVTVRFLQPPPVPPPGVRIFNNPIR
jgi:hypothetical protein